MKMWFAIIAAFCVGSIRLGFFLLGDQIGMSESRQISISWPFIETAVFIVSIIAFAKIALKETMSRYLVWSIVFLTSTIAFIIFSDYVRDYGLLKKNNWSYATIILDFIAGILCVSTYRIISSFKRTKDLQDNQRGGLG